MPLFSVFARFAPLAALVSASLVLAAPALAQDEPQADLGPLYQQPPFDRVVLKSNEQVDVAPLRFAGGTRAVPDPLPTSGALQVRPLEAPEATAEYEIPWASIARIELFEDLILQQAVELTTAGKFNEAYNYFGYLFNKARQTRGLDVAVSQYLQANAQAAFRGGEFDRALAILGSLYERAPNSRVLPSAVDTVAERIIQQQLEQRDFQSARITLDVVEQQFRGLPLTVVTKWRNTFERAATNQLAEATRLVDERQYLAARRAIQQATAVWPELAGATELQARIQREYPVVMVGVLESTPREPAHRLDNWASSRTATLVAPTLVELRDFSAEGGVYQSSVAQVASDASGLGLTIELADPPSGNWLATGLGASALARRLLAASDPDDPDYQPALSDLISKVEVAYPQQVQVSLARPHVRPEALLTLPLPRQLFASSGRGVFEIAEYNDNVVRFAVQGGEGAIAEVHEVPFETDEEAALALLRGGIDVLARVSPWQVATLRQADDVAVDSYRLPTVHVLAPTGRSPLTDQREFRRALCYAIDRERIVRDVLLGGQEQPGFQVVSGPFPAGVTLSDPIRYGYNGQIKPRVWDPRLAAILASVAWANVQKAAGNEDVVVDLPTLKLGHTADPIARTACQVIAQDLAILGIHLELVELTPAEMLHASDQVDLKYVELNLWEPVVDARRLLGPGGLLGDSSDFMSVALDRLDLARNWNEVRSRLYEIHDIASTDLPVVPLWQTVNYFAYRREVTGISPQPVRLYQDMGRWQIDYGSERL